MKGKHSTRKLAMVFGWLAEMFLVSSAIAMPATERFFNLTQPNGKVLQVRLRGDEHNHWIETKSGLPIGRAVNGYWYFVQSYNGKKPLLSTNRADLNPPKNFNAPSVPLDAVSTPFDSSQLRTGPLSPKVLIILVDYDNQPATYTSKKKWSEKIISTDAAAKTIADFYAEASYGAVNISPAAETHGIDSDGVIGWLRLGPTHPVSTPITNPDDMGQVGYDIARAAVAEADAHIDFAALDVNKDGAVSGEELAIVVVVAGYDASTTTNVPSVWGEALNGQIIKTADTHDRVVTETVCEPVSPDLTEKPGYDGPTEICHEEESVVKNPVSLVDAIGIVGEIQETDSEGIDDHQATLGVFVHELGHVIFKLPDLYDTDFSSSGIGAFDFMSGGSWGRDYRADSYIGETPVLPSAWTQYKLNWVTANSYGPLDSAGRPSIPAKQPHVGVAHIGQKQVNGSWDCANTSEYFLMQYRADVGYDRGLIEYFDPVVPGLAIFHVDESVDSNTRDDRRLVDLEEANNMEVGQWNGFLYNQHLWYQGNATLFNNSSIPSSKSEGNWETDVEIEVLDSFTNISFEADRAARLESSPLPEGQPAVNIRIDSPCDGPVSHHMPVY